MNRTSQKHPLHAFYIPHYSDGTLPGGFEKRMSYANLLLLDLRINALPKLNAVNLQCRSSGRLLEISCLRVTSSIAFCSVLVDVMPCIKVSQKDKIVSMLAGNGNFNISLWTFHCTDLGVGGSLARALSDLVNKSISPHDVVYCFRPSTKLLISSSVVTCNASGHGFLKGVWCCLATSPYSSK